MRPGCVLRGRRARPVRSAALPGVGDGRLRRPVAGRRRRPPCRSRSRARSAWGRRRRSWSAPDEAVAVPTGGVVPDGADAVVPIELCEVDGRRVTVLRPHPAGKHVRPAGEDARAGELLVAAGRRLRAPDVGALAAAGIATVRRAPARPRRRRVDGRRARARPASRSATRRSTTRTLYTLIAAVREAGATPVDGGTVRRRSGRAHRRAGRARRTTSTPRVLGRRVDGRARPGEARVRARRRHRRS